MALVKPTGESLGWEQSEENIGQKHAGEAVMGQSVRGKSSEHPSPYTGKPEDDCEAPQRNTDAGLPFVGTRIL